MRPPGAEETPLIPLIRPNLSLTDIPPALRQPGPAGTLLAEELRAYFGAAGVFVVRSGRWALFRVLKALGVGAGHEVILPALCCATVPNAVLAAGATPVFCDSRPGVVQMAPESVSRLTTRRTRAVVAVHLFGFPPRMDALAEFCRCRGLWLLEDCAHCLGGALSGRRCGTWGEAAFFSFGWSKPLGTPGGGALVVHSRETLARVNEGPACRPARTTIREVFEAVAVVSLLRPSVYDAVDHMVRRREHAADKEVAAVAGGSSPFAAALALRQWRRYPLTLRRRRANAELLTRLVSGQAPVAADLEHAVPAPLTLPVRHSRAAWVQSALETHGFRLSTVAASAFGPLPALPQFGRFPAEWNHARVAAEQTLLLPLHLDVKNTIDLGNLLVTELSRRKGRHGHEHLSA